MCNQNPIPSLELIIPAINSFLTILINLQSILRASYCGINSQCSMINHFAKSIILLVLVGLVNSHNEYLRMEINRWMVLSYFSAWVSSTGWTRAFVHGHFQSWSRSKAYSYMFMTKLNLFSLFFFWHWALIACGIQTDCDQHVNDMFPLSRDSTCDFPQA